MTVEQHGPEQPASLQSGLPSSPELKAAIADFMDRSGELLAHELATYKPSYKMLVTRNDKTGEVTYSDLDHNLLPKEQLVYFATIERPILFTKSEPTYVPKLVAALGHEHPALHPVCGQISKGFKKWRNTLIVGVQTTAGIPEQALPDNEWKLTNAWTAPVGTLLPAELNDEEMVEDFHFARIYLNGFVWHNDAEKTAEYRAASKLMQLHYRKCAELRVFSGLQQIIKPIHDYLAQAQAAGEDL